MDDSNKECNSKNGMGCPVKNTLDIIGGKWKPYIIRILMINEVVRYNELKRQVDGITDMMLSQSLKELEQDNIIKRTQYNVIPPRVEYSLTERGKELSSVMSELSKWGRTQE
ncbi:transcriptional regulator, HxlR family [Clostridium sp. DL-VIII]|uniref:winged helix-turn-helix transcriptional regulator n=1 Tax=Clostridium sp. DL-VIII TaxID=641107 RepID=UPI00023B0243|nr:helix-turn-helix domain-containing protein [Clostridium sp. DL-VIII]EHI99935.1 transcriptional regulator, HxlR family [Clostridium sp. DL-VIII]